jgi:NAD(P)-dependent dehydrogenase (short-subunit alcohol dehydrogenase family)
MPSGEPVFAEMTAVVTGASGGIGGAIAVALSERGAAVCLGGRDTQRLEAAAERVDATGRGRAEVYRADLTVESELADMTAALRARRDGVDILVHSAGEFARGRFEETPVEVLDRLVALNVRSAFLLTQELVPALKPRKGQVVFINSSVSVATRALVGPYALTQHARRALTDTFRHELNEHGVRVLGVYPGRTATRMQAEIHRLEGRPYEPSRLLQPGDVADVIAAALALPRTAEVTDLHVRPAERA